jgi:transcriptional regulator with XRE-family HTH domain
MPTLDSDRKTSHDKFDWNVGVNIRYLRTVAEIEQRTLAKLADINQSQLSRIESGKRSLKFKEGMAIAKILGVRPERLTKEVINAEME